MLGFGVRKLSSQFLKSMASNMMVEENTDNLYSQSTYDIAMEALSSLITGKRRGDGPDISTKYSKLDRMMMYIKVIMWIDIIIIIHLVYDAYAFIHCNIH